MDFRLQIDMPNFGGQNMQKKYNSQLVPFARQLRSEMTKEERHLWYDFLRTYPIRFSRQKVLGKYIADFYSAKVGLVIELDGSQHYEEKNMEADAARTAFLEGYDLKVIRIPNNEIAQNFRGVCEYIDSVVKQRLKAPLGHKGSWPEGPEGIRTLQISEHSEIRSKSPPSFADANATSALPRGARQGEAHPEQTLHQSIKKRPSNLWKITPIFSCAEAYGVV